MHHGRAVPVSVASPRQRLAPRFAPTVAAFGRSQDASELELRLFSHHYFKELLAAGIVRYVRLGVRPPESGRENDGIASAISFIRRHRLEERWEWPELLSGPFDDQRLVVVAEAWSVEPKELRASLRALRGRDPSSVSGVHHAGLETIAQAVDVPLSLLEVAANFVDRYSITHQQFVDSFLTGSAQAEKVALVLGADVGEVREVLTAVAQIGVVEMPAHHAASVPAGPGSSPVAAVAMEAGALVVRLLTDSVQRRFTIDQERARSWAAGSDRRAREAVLAWVRALNERAGATLLVLRWVCRCQERFVHTGAARDLAPISQSDVARAIGYHRSIVSRTARAVRLQTPHGVMSLATLTPGSGPVVRALARDHPSMSDGELATAFATRSGVALSRRTIHYHRNRIVTTG